MSIEVGLSGATVGKQGNKCEGKERSVEGGQEKRGPRIITAKIGFLSLVQVMNEETRGRKGPKASGHGAASLFGKDDWVFGLSGIVTEANRTLIRNRFVWGV